MSTRRWCLNNFQRNMFVTYPRHPCWHHLVRASVSSVLSEPLIVLPRLIVSRLPRPQHNPSSQSLTRGGSWADWGNMSGCQAHFWKHNTHNHYSVTRNVTLDLELFKSFKLNFQTVKWKLSSVKIPGCFKWRWLRCRKIWSPNSLLSLCQNSHKLYLQLIFCCLGQCLSRVQIWIVWMIKAISLWLNPISFCLLF